MRIFADITSLKVIPLTDSFSRRDDPAIHSTCPPAMVLFVHRPMRIDGALLKISFVDHQNCTTIKPGFSPTTLRCAIGNRLCIFIQS